MSNVNAIAVATEGLKAILQRAFAEADGLGVTGAQVIAVRPTAIPAEFKGVNVFLYQVTTNAALRNYDLPTRRDSGELMQRPQLALDLHYLLTFVGDELGLEPQRMLGAAGAGLHAHAELTPDDIEQIAQHAPPGSYLRHHNDLAQQVDRVRFLLSALNVEELSKLWMMFPQKPYDLSAAVQASVVLVEAPLTPAPTRPVLRRGIYSGMPRPPALTALSPQLTPRMVSGARARLTLDGVALVGRATRVRLGDLAPVSPLSTEETRVVVEIPDALPAGIHQARVLVAHTFDDAGTTRDFELESNALPFVLEPVITTASPITTSVGGAMTIDVVPPIADRQRVLVLVGNRAIAWQTPIPSGGGPTASFTVMLPNEIAAGQYPLRIEVDGATSRLTDPPDSAPPGTLPTPFVEVVP